MMAAVGFNPRIQISYYHSRRGATFDRFYKTSNGLIRIILHTSLRDVVALFSLPGVETPGYRQWSLRDPWIPSKDGGLLAR